MTDSWYTLPTTSAWPPADRRAFRSFAHRVEGAEWLGDIRDLRREIRGDSPRVVAACHVLADIVAQGWGIRVDETGVAVRAPEAELDAAAEKARVRTQELLKRDEQLSMPSVRRFIRDMERPREFMGEFVSIFNLMRDGVELAETLLSTVAGDRGRGEWRRAIEPYVQIVNTSDRCDHTGLRLLDVWRYFRHTWTNQYTSTPGRTLLIIVRDRAARFHPVIGIAALSSAVVQIRERDEWIGWQPQDLLALLDRDPDPRVARWIMQRLDDSVAQLHLDDLVEDGLYWPSLWDQPADDVVEKLMKEAEIRRRDHHRFARQSDFKRRVRDEDNPGIWRDRAESDLFRSKRCLALADLLRARRVLAPLLVSKTTRAGLRAALDNPQARRAIGTVLRRAKAEAVGTEIADLTVCGAISPYNILLGGKLVSMLAVSPSVLRAYHERYRNYASEIASSLAGRPIRRRSNLVFVGTTSLYGSSTSQYNRLRLPASVLGAMDDIVFRRLGKSRSFGTSHLSNESVNALVRLAEQSRTGVRVNSIFGEGVNPKLRKIRYGLDLLEWPSDELLQHRRPRIVYGISLVTNLLPYLLGLDKTPKYHFRRNTTNDTERINDWWYERWLSKRAQSPDILATVRTHTLVRPVRHGARVELPPSDLLE